MTDDTHDETSPDAALADPVFDELFSALREVGCRPAPEVQPALAALLSGAAAGRRRRRVRGATAGLAVVGVLAGGVGAAAATGHLLQPPAVARVAHSPSEIAVTGEPVEHPTPVGVPPSTHATPTARPAPADTDPGDSVGTRTDAGPDPEPTRPRSGTSPASQGPTSDDDEGADDEGTVETPEPQESGDDHADDGGDLSGETDGGAGEDAAGEDGAVRAG